MPNFLKTEAGEALDIAWNEGFLSDSRPYRAEFWVENNVTMLTFIFSTHGMETFTDDRFQVQLSEEGLVEFVSEVVFVFSMTTTDASGKGMLSVNVVIGTEDDGVLAKEKVKLRPYT